MSAPQRINNLAVAAHGNLKTNNLFNAILIANVILIWYFDILANVISMKIVNRSFDIHSKM